MAPRYDVDLTDEQRRQLVYTCDWGGCNGLTIGLRKHSHTGEWLSVCSEHVRMGNTIILGEEGVLGALNA